MNVNDDLNSVLKSGYIILFIIITVLFIMTKIDLWIFKRQAISNHVGYYHPVTKQFILVTNSEPAFYLK